MKVVEEGAGARRRRGGSPSATLTPAVTRRDASLQPLTCYVSGVNNITVCKHAAARS